MRLVDTHAHLCDEQFSGVEGEILDRARKVGVEAILNIGTTRKSSELVLEAAFQHGQLKGAVGIHPNYCHQAQPDDWERIEQLAQNPLVAAIGETGLDKYWQDCPWEIQLEYFERHMQLAQRVALPIIVHMRECDQEMVEVLQRLVPKYGISGVMHSFTSTWDVCKACLDLGFYISFAGQLTYKKSGELRQLAAKVPADRVLVETDAPYLSPEPWRSVRPNEPGRIIHTLEVLADNRLTSREEMGICTTENAYRLFPRLATVS